MTINDAYLVLKTRVTEKDLDNLAPDVTDAILTIQKYSKKSNEPIWKSDEHFINACNESYLQGKTDQAQKDIKELGISEAELIVAKMYIKDEIAKFPTCMELQTISKILDSFEKKCPKGNDTHWTCYEVCEHRENGICTLNN